MYINIFDVTSARVQFDTIGARPVIRIRGADSKETHFSLTLWLDENITVNPVAAGALTMKLPEVTTDDS